MSNALATPSLLALAVLLSSCASRWSMQVEPAAGGDAPGELATLPLRVTVVCAQAPGSDRETTDIVLSGDLILDFAQGLVKRRVFESVRLPTAIEPEADDVVLRVEQHVGWGGTSARQMLDYLTLGLTHHLLETDEFVFARGEVTLRRSGQDVRTWKARSEVHFAYRSQGKTKEREAEACWAAIEALHSELVEKMTRDRDVFLDG